MVTGGFMTCKIDVGYTGYSGNGSNSGYRGPYGIQDSSWLH